MVAKYTLAWFGLMMLAILNGVVRDLTYSVSAGEFAAHQISTGTLLVLSAAFVWILSKVWHIESVRQAWTIGTVWFVLTEAFEFGMARIVRGYSWDVIFHSYDIFAGELWILIPLWILVAPLVFYRANKSRSTAS
jgi:hypothetical protein